MGKKCKTARASTTKTKTKKVDAPVDYSKPLENSKYEMFCQQYSIDSNGKRSAIAAGYSKKTAEVRASQLLRILKVAERVRRLQLEISALCGVDAKRLMEEWKKIGFANMKRIMSGGNAIKDISQLPEEVTAAIESVSVSKTARGKNVKVTMHSKVNALENMGKHVGFYRKDNEQRLGMTLADIAALAGAINVSH